MNPVNKEQDEVIASKTFLEWSKASQWLVSWGLVDNLFGAKFVLLWCTDPFPGVIKDLAHLTALRGDLDVTPVWLSWGIAILVGFKTKQLEGKTASSAQTGRDLLCSSSLWRCWAPVGPSRAVDKPSQGMTQQAGVCSQLRQFQNKWRNSTGLVLQPALLDCCGRAAAARSAPSQLILHLAVAFFFRGEARISSHKQGQRMKSWAASEELGGVSVETLSLFQGCWAPESCRVFLS